MLESPPPPVEEVWLYEMPFITLIASSVETFETECCGLLLGYRSWSSLDKVRRAIIEQAYQFQMSERTRFSVSIPEEEDECVDMIYKLSMYEPLGYFHSHPNERPLPSPCDMKHMYINQIELILSIRNKKHNVPWRYDSRKKELSGVFGDYRFELSAITKVNEKRYKKLELLCPFALGIGSRYFDTQISLR
ncbi:MAG: Mov34/MPN/PAD-1 family protein [Candidatus Sifarchaeia archaeon]|jgi:proteasome lid subunit RPN8/RPN11